MGLREDLINCGFWFLNSSSLPADFLLEMAIREFQRYAGLDWVAQEPPPPGAAAYWANLTPVSTAGHKYTGKITGNADADTQTALAYWIANRWRCPVVIIAFSTDSAGRHQFQENIWLYNDLKIAGKVRVYARDLSGVYFPIPTSIDDLQLLGKFQPYGGGGGPISLPKQGAAIQITPDLLLGHTITTAETPTYKVIRTSAERESAGYFDCINAWDSVFISVGTCHWTLGSFSKKKKALQPGELGAYLSYLRKYQPTAYDAAVGRWGVYTEKEWDKPGFFDISQRKYTTHLQEWKGATPALANILSENEANFFRSWHWFYRFEMSARYSTGFQQKMWDMTRIRVRDVLTTPFAAGGPRVRNGDGTFRNATLQDVFTAELTVAWLLRWHIKFPAHVVKGGVVGPKLAAAVTAAKISTDIVNDWPDTAQPCLREKLRIAAIAALGDDVTRVEKFDVPILGPLSKDKNSFSLFDTGLPAAPWPDHAAPTSSFESIVTTIQARIILNAFVSGIPVYSVLSNGVTFTEQYSNGGSIGSIANVDRLAFSDLSGNLLFAMPVLVGQLSALTVDDPGAGNAKVRIDGSMRCFVPSDKSEDIDFSFRLAHAGGVPTFTTIKWDEIGTFGAHIPLTIAGLAAAGELVQKVNQGHLMPLAATTLGLSGNRVSPGYYFLWAFSFQDTQGQNPKAARFRLQIRHQFYLDKKTESMDPFGLTFDSSLMGTITNVSLGDPINYIEIKQTQIPQESDDAAPPFTWLLQMDVPQQATLETFNEVATEPVGVALETISTERPVTFLPTFTSVDPAGAAPRWTAYFALIDNVKDADIKRDQFKIQRSKPKTIPNNSVLILPRRLSPTTETGTASATAEFKNVRITTGQSLQCTCSIRPPDEDVLAKSYAEANLDQDPAILFRFDQITPAKYKTSPPPGPQVVRIGSLDLVFPPSAIPADGVTISGYNPSSDIVWSVAVHLADADAPAPARLRSLSFLLAVAAIFPGGQDDVPMDSAGIDLAEDPTASSDYEKYFTRQRPLMLVDRQLKSAWDAPFALAVVEKTGPNLSQTLQLRILRGGKDPDTNPTRSLVLDPQPFLVAQVDASRFESDLVASVSTELGNWSNRDVNGAAWELANGVSGFDLLLPPQGVGEAMHRRTGAGDITPTKPVDFRFTPNARLTLQPSYFAQRFAEAPWNLRRLLGSPGDPSPGAAITAMEYELFYGLYGHLPRPRGLRLAEIQARLGALPQRQPSLLPWRYDQNLQGPVYLRYRMLWATLYSALASRLSVLEPWDADFDGQPIITKSDSLSYELRNTSHLRYPIPGAVAGDPPAGFDAEDGLAGGWAWPFESNNILQAVLRDRISRDAEVNRLYFSALGGWGHEKASFDNGNTTIYTEVSMGRVSSITVERRGRITVFFNRAKHVIVYCRTTAASRQFYLEQESLLGNPVLRKVEEYVELLEEDRPFPDRTASNSSRGFVTSCFFPGQRPPRILVNSRWGQDVGDIGWKVPLWIRNAAPADVYPKPHVILKLAAETEDLKTPAAIYDPEKLFFFTATDPKLGPDVESWPPVQGVDFEYVDYDAAPPDPDTGQGDPWQFKGKKADAPIQPGAGAFTFRLEPASGVANVVADRAAPALARIDNVTLMRQVVQKANARPQLHVDAQALRDHLSNAVSPVMGLIAAGKDPSDALKDLKDRFAPFANAISTLDPASLSSEKICDAIKNRAESEFDVAADAIRAEMNGAMAGAFTQLQLLVDQANKLFSGNLDQAAVMLQDGTQEIVKTAQDALNKVRGTTAEITNALTDAKTRIDGSIALARKFLGEGQCIACGGTNPPQDALDATRDGVLDALRQADSIVSAAVQKFTGGSLNAASKVFRQTVLWPAESKFRDICVELRKPSPKLTSIKTWLDNIDQLLDAGVTALKAKLDSWNSLLTGAETVGDLATPLIQNVKDAIAGANHVWKAFSDNLNEATKKLNQQLSDRIEQKIALLRAGLGNQVNALCQQVLPTKEDLIGFLKNLFPQSVFDNIAKQLQNLTGLSKLGGFAVAELDRLYSSAVSELNHFVDRVHAALPAPKVDLGNLGSVQLLRAFGDVPRLPHLDFSLPQSGYYFFDFVDPVPTLAIPDLLPHVDLTPLAAFANQTLAGIGRDLLNPLNLQIPTTQLLDRLIPYDLTHFDLSKVFPNVAGIDFSKLFPGLKVPDGNSDNVKVTHGIDAPNRSAWLQMSIDVKLGDETELFSFFGVRMALERGRFQGFCRVAASAGQPPRRRVNGSVSGDWDLQIGGHPIAQMTDCTLSFEDGGGISFNITPDKVHLEPPLDFLSDLMEDLGLGDSGFSVALSATGLTANLNLPLPDVQAGSFGIANLVLGFSFALSFLPSGPQNNFSIGVGLNVGRKMAPFTITIFILGGAGYFETDVTYVPNTGALSTHVAIGIFAAASLAISLGPISGGIYAYFGITVDYTAGTGQAGSLTVGILILFRGEVSLLGFISVSLCVSLEAQYSQGRLTGRGQVSYSIKIGWFFSINVSVSISYTFGSAGGGPLEALEAGAFITGDPYVDAARNYVEMFVA